MNKGISNLQIEKFLRNKMKHCRKIIWEPIQLTPSVNILIFIVL